MPETFDALPDFSISPSPEQEDKEAEIGGWGAAFRLENDVANAYELLTRPEFKDDPTFDPGKAIKDYDAQNGTGLWEDYRDNFLGVRSQDEFIYRAGRVEREIKDRQAMAENGWGGLAQSVVAGVLSPTMFIPFAGAGLRGARLARSAAGFGLAGAALQEAPLMANQETRTGAEVATSLAASTILGGMLGGAVGALRKGEWERLEQMLERGDMDIPQYGNAIPGAAGAQSSQAPFAGGIDPGPLGLARGVQATVDSNPVTRSPVTSNLNSGWRSAQWNMAQYSDAGIGMTGNRLNVPTTPGGTAESRISTWYGNYAKAVEGHDQAYADYYFDGAVPRVLPNQRAAVGGALHAGGKISRAEFNREVARAAFSGDIHPDPNQPFAKAASQAAQAWRKEVYDPVLKALQEVEALPKELKEIADQSYLNWMFHHEKIVANPNGFIDFLAKEFDEAYTSQFAERAGKFQERQKKTDTLLEDIQRPEDEIAEMREQFQEEMEQLEAKAEADQLTVLQDTIANLRAQARRLGESVQDKEYKRQLLADAKSMEKEAGEPLKEFRARKRAIQTRVSNLNKSQLVMENKLANKIEKIERTEELSLATLRRAARAGQKAQRELDKVSDDKLDDLASRLRDQFAKTAEMYDRGEERIIRLSEGDSDPLLRQVEIQAERADKLTSIANRLGEAEGMDRAELRQLIEEGLEETLVKIQSVVSKRAIRNAKLMEQARTMAPENIKKRIEQITGEKIAREVDFLENMRQLGLDTQEVDLANASADFKRLSREDAIKVKDKILGTYLRLPVVEVAQGERGAVLARNLGFIPSSRMSEWLDMDMERLAKSHLRTMAPDIEIARKFGTIDLGEIMQPVVDEMNAKIEALKTAKNKKGQPLSEQETAKRSKQIHDEFDLIKQNIEGVHGRLRNNRGIPKNPDGIGYRLAHTVMNLNVLRYMGNVTISSIPDVARPVMRHGLARVFKDGFLPFVTGMKELKLLKSELRAAGVGVEVMTNARAMAMNDILDDMARGSKFEKGTQWLTNRMGIIALFNYWTDALKTFSGTVSNARIMDSIHTVVNGGADQKASMEYLNQLGIGMPEALEIWEEVLRTGGGSKVNGVWLPNTESWRADGKAVRNFRAAVSRDVNNIIVTPGAERPLWMDANTFGRLAGQFKGFAFASTTKTLMAGLQQRDAAFGYGALISLAFGALSYYIAARLAGGEREQEMLDADLDQWADRAIESSGLLGTFGLAQDMLSRIPATQPYSSFSGGRTIRRGGDDVVSNLMGPSFDFAVQAGNVLTGIDDPTQSTLHSARKLAPFQNTAGPVPYLLQLRDFFDLIEENSNLPERRQ